MQVTVITPCWKHCVPVLWGCFAKKAASVCQCFVLTSTLTCEIKNQLEERSVRTEADCQSQRSPLYPVELGWWAQRKTVNPQVMTEKHWPYLKQFLSSVVMLMIKRNVLR